MSRCMFLIALVATFFLPGFAFGSANDGPPISITSPDTGRTFTLGTIKSRALVWDKKNQVLTVHVTFTDAEQNLGDPNDDQHQFRLPGIKFDEAKGLFYAISAKGEAIPVAHMKKVAFFKVVEATPNAVVRIQHPSGIITVSLEAISPNDPAMHAPPPDTNPDDTHKVDPGSILQ